MNPMNGDAAKLTDFPLLVFVISLVLLTFSLWAGARLLRRWLPPQEHMRETFDIILGASLTLMGLIVAFSFSMAVSRYDQRKNLEEAEANAIGTEYVRADLLPDAEAAKVRALMREYFEQRVLFYTVRDPEKLRDVDARTAALQGQMWAVVAAHAKANPVPPATLVAAGMNEVLNSQGYTQAAWWNRIPAAAWILMTAIAVCCHVLVGYGTRNAREELTMMLVLPLVLSISFFLIADIDSPRRGVIRVLPQNLMSIAASVSAR
jgi:hypothetical protein